MFYLDEVGSCKILRHTARRLWVPGGRRLHQQADMIHWWSVLARGWMDGWMDGSHARYGRTDGQTVATLSAGDLIECSFG
jgi:predicted RNA binding protein YcfA (HicA-like mRNA interferase family)